MRNVLIWSVVIIAVAVLIGFLIVNHKTEEEKIVDYNRCVSREMDDYLVIVEPLVSACANGNYTACKVANENIEKKKVEVGSICRTYLK